MASAKSEIAIALDAWLELPAISVDNQFVFAANFVAAIWSRVIVLRLQVLTYIGFLRVFFTVN